MVKSLFKIIAAMAVGSSSASAQNNYNANISVRITSVIIYTNDTDILFTATPMPSPLNCNPSYFVVPNTISAENRQMILSRLLVSYSSKEQVNIGFDDLTCPDGHVRVYRVG